jgi:CHAD domain-containing protein
MRSAFRILDPYYKSKPTRPFIAGLRKLARALGEVRDLDVMIENLADALKGEDEDAQAGVGMLIDRLERKRRRARRKLVAHLDDPTYAKFKAAFAVFLTRPGKAALDVSGDGVGVVPHQVRHVLPAILHDHLARVRAYDTVIQPARAAETDEDSADDDGGGQADAPRAEAAPDAEAERPDTEALHALRIEFKRLRYATDFFGEVLGPSGEKFIKEIKTIQDHLGRLNDMVVAQAQLHTLLDDIGLDEAVLHSTLVKLAAEQARLEDNFPRIWARFNQRSVQSQLANALLVLR